MKKSGILWGIAFVAVGVILALNALDITDIDLFFDGWWTLFIIVPCGIGLFTEREKFGNAIGVACGVLLLLGCQDIFDFSMLWKLLVPALIVVIGIKMVLNAVSSGRSNEILDQLKEDGKTPKSGCATFSGCDLNFDGEVFEGAELTATFGGVKCDLRGAIIENDSAIHVSAIFGGITILVPETVNIKVSTNSMFGGVSNKTPARKDVPTIYVSGTCMFGGVDIK